MKSIGSILSQKDQVKRINNLHASSP